MSTITREQVLEQVEGLGVPLANVFLIAEDDDTEGVIAIWYPEIGLRSLVIEKDELAHAVYRYFQDAGARRFRSWQDLQEAQHAEKWAGWNTCADWRRLEEAAVELAKSDNK
jgi:hypothetical protein